MDRAQQPLSDNRAIGTGANPARQGTPGGGSGGAIYNDGDRITLSVGGSVFTGNHANEGGGATSSSADDRTGTMAIRPQTLETTPISSSTPPGLAGIFFLGAHRPRISHSTVK